MRTFTPETRAWHFAYTASVVLGAFCSAACGVAVEDQTPHTLVRTASGFYQLTARIERASSLTAIVGVEGRDVLRHICDDARR